MNDFLQKESKNLSLRFFRSATDSKRSHGHSCDHVTFTLEIHCQYFCKYLNMNGLRIVCIVAFLLRSHGHNCDRDHFHCSHADTKAGKYKD